jgi:hypothetical protein
MGPAHALGLVRQVVLGVAHICVKGILLFLNLAYKTGGKHPSPPGHKRWLKTSSN